MQGRAAGRILLEAVMALEDFHVEILARFKLLAACPTSWKSTLTDRLMFGAMSKAVWWAAASIS